MKRHLLALESGELSLRVPHVTETVQYDPASPYNHFSDWTNAWQASSVSQDATHHLAGDGRPAYQARFLEVLKFHAPGLAPVLDDSGAYHITPDGMPAYESRHTRTFGFYEGRAAVHSADGWFHVLPDGSPLYSERYAWCGNFQEGRCTVRGSTTGATSTLRKTAPRPMTSAIVMPGTSRTATRWCSAMTGGTATYRPLRRFVAWAVVPRPGRVPQELRPRPR